MSANVALRTHEEAVPAYEATNQRLLRLRQIIKQESLMLGDFTLSSGLKSTYFFQLRQTTMHPEGATLIGDLVVDFMQRQNINCIGGLVHGAVPVVQAVNLMSFQKRFPVSAFFVRKAAKEHGAKELIDGHIVAGGEALIVDDVTTTGGSIWQAVEAISEKQCKIVTALSIVDREEGAAQFLAERGITLFSLFKRSDFNIA